MPKKDESVEPSRFKPPFIRAWRKQKGMSLDALAAAAKMDKGNLSKVERGQLPYNQETLERIADALETEPALLIAGRPSARILLLYDRAPEAVQRQIVEVAETLIRTSAAE